MSGRRFCRRRRSSLSTVVVVVGRRLRRSSSSVVRHFPFSSKGGTFEKNQIFAVFQKTRNFSKIQDFRQNEWTRFFSRRRRRRVVVVVGRCLRRSSPSSVVRHFPFLSKGGTFEKNQIFACNFSKIRDFRQNRDRRRRPSSVISLFRPREGPLKKIKFFCFQKTRNFSQIRDFRQNEWTRFFRRRRVVAVDGRRRRRSLPSSVVAVVRRPSFPFFVQGRDL